MWSDMKLVCSVFYIAAQQLVICVRPSAGEFGQVRQKPRIQPSDISLSYTNRYAHIAGVIKNFL